MPHLLEVGQAGIAGGGQELLGIGFQLGRAVRQLGQPVFPELFECPCLFLGCRGQGQSIGLAHRRRGGYPLLRRLFTAGNQQGSKDKGGGGGTHGQASRNEIMGQLRWRASACSRSSPSTTKGWVTCSSSGRSLIESL